MREWTVQKRVMKLLVAAATGSTVIGSSCASDVRDQLVSGGLSYVESTSNSVLSELFPIDQLVANLTPFPAN